MEENSTKEVKEMSFWDHLDDLRWTLMRITIGVIVCVILVFMNKGLVFDTIVFAPGSSDFVVYRALCSLAEKLSFPDLCVEPFKISLINTTVSGQFFTHISTSFWFGLILALPWIFYQLWLFISPALYSHERKYARRVFAAGSFLFFMGTAVSYFIVFPITIKFLGTYQLSDIPGAVPNLITIGSYIDTFIILTMCMGIVFEMPIVIYFLSKIGLVSKSFLKKYRRYAVVIILIISAVITPTADPFTMLVVSIPILLLYELSIYVCRQ